MSTVRQRLIDAIRASLGVISLQNGYSTDAGLSIHEWRDPETEPIQDSEMPCILIRDESGDVSDLDYDTSEHSLTLNVSVVDQGDDAPRLARSLEGDVLKAFGVDQTFGGLCHYFQLSNSITSVRQSGKRSAGIMLTFDVKFRTKAFDLKTAVPYPT